MLFALNKSHRFRRLVVPQDDLVRRHRLAKDPLNLLLEVLGPKPGG
jgi:hypothetical protein